MVEKLRKFLNNTQSSTLRQINIQHVALLLISSFEFFLEIFCVEQMWAKFEPQKKWHCTYHPQNNLLESDFKRMSFLFTELFVFCNYKIHIAFLTDFARILMNFSVFWGKTKKSNNIEDMKGTLILKRSSSSIMYFSAHRDFLEHTKKKAVDESSVEGNVFQKKQIVVLIYGLPTILINMKSCHSQIKRLSTADGLNIQVGTVAVYPRSLRA